MQSELRRLPSVDKIISDERIKKLRAKYPHELIVDAVRLHLEILRPRELRAAQRRKS